MNTLRSFQQWQGIYKKGSRHCIAQYPVDDGRNTPTHDELADKCSQECDTKRQVYKCHFPCSHPAHPAQTKQGGREGRRARRARDVWWGSQAAAPASSRLKPLTVQPTPLPPVSRLALPLQRGLKPNKEKVKPFQIYRTVLFKIESNPAMRQGYEVTKVRIGKDLTS